MLQGKVAIITGGTRGIGFATVKLFLENGAKVALLGSKKETVEKAIKELKEINKQYDVLGFYPDLNDIDMVRKTFQEVEKTYGKLDILINNAGISAKEKIDEYDSKEFKKIMDLNVTAVFHCSKVASEIMKKQNGGVILNTSSMVSLYGQPSGCGYPASKFAVNGLTKSLARELGKDHIRVNAVAPGVIQTDMMRNVKEEILKPVINSIPLKRIGKPEEVANAFLFLASDLASYITGAILSVDGAAMN